MGKGSLASALQADLQQYPLRCVMLQVRHPGDAGQLQVNEPIAEHRSGHLCCEALPPRRFRKGKACLNDWLASDVVQQVKTKARASVALDGHPNAKAGMFVVVLQNPDSQ